MSDCRFMEGDIPMDVEEIKERGARDMESREMKEHQIDGKVFECPYCNSPAYIMPMALLTFEPRWEIYVTVTCPSCGKDIYVKWTEEDA